ncbi:MAG: DUF5658 family protein [Chloroflexota bacterium]
MASLTRQLRAVINNPLVAAYLLLNMADLMTTIIGLAVGARELNPFAARWIANMGPALGVLALKLLLAGVTIVALMRIQARRVRWGLHWNLLRLGILVYGLVVLSNLFTIGSRLQTLF